MPWYFYVIEFFTGVLLTNGIPHFVQGLSGNRFQSPFAKPPGVGESSALVNAVWGFANLLAGAVLLVYFHPVGSQSILGWITIGIGSFITAIFTSWHFGNVRAHQKQ
jgi:hypothetical protein